MFPLSVSAAPLYGHQGTHACKNSSLQMGSSHVLHQNTCTPCCWKGKSRNPYSQWTSGLDDSHLGLLFNRDRTKTSVHSPPRGVLRNMRSKHGLETSPLKCAWFTRAKISENLLESQNTRILKSTLRTWNELEPPARALAFSPLAYTEGCVKS